MSFFPVVLPLNPSLKRTTIEELEFTADKTDSYFGRCSSSDNYTLPENQQLFSNSGYEIDEKGLYASVSDSTDRLLFWNYQFALLEAKKVSFYFYLYSANSFVLNLFSPVSPQVRTNNSYTIYFGYRDFLDAGGASAYNIVVKSYFNYPSDSYWISELEVDKKQVNFYQSNSNYSAKSLIGSVDILFRYQGILIPGWSGAATNAGNRSRKITIERYI